MLKRIRSIPVKKKMIDFRFVKEKSDLLLETNKKGFGKRIYIHETNLLCMHHILKKSLQPNFQSLL